MRDVLELGFLVSLLFAVAIAKFTVLDSRDLVDLLSCRLSDIYLTLEP